MQLYNQPMLSPRNTIPSIPVMGVNIADIRRDEALRHIDNAFSNDTLLTVAFANANLLNLARNAPGFREAVNSFLVLNDGIALDFATWLIHGRRFPDNLNGTDFTPLFLAHTSHQLRVFILGAAPGVAEMSQRNLSSTYPRHEFVGVHSGFFADTDIEKISQSIRDSKADVLLVGMGNPKQEWWLAHHLPDTGCRLGFAIGAFIDFSSGNAKRAPRIFQILRIEWLFRLVLEPRRLLKRYTVTTGKFFFAALRERFWQNSPNS
jgi:alpha-1,3-mannosyltransferase